MVTEINDQSKGPFGVVASATDKGLLRLEEVNGGDIQVKLASVSTFVTAITDGTNATTPILVTVMLLLFVETLP